MSSDSLKHVDVLFTGAVPPRVSEGVNAAFNAVTLPTGAEREAFLKTHGPKIRGIAASSGHGKIGADLFQHFPKLEIVSSFGVGYDNIDVEEAGRRGIVVTNTPDVLTDEVADLTLGLLIATIREIPRAEQYVRLGKWKEKAYPLTATLRDRKVGILGLGRIGKAIARRCEGFGLPVSYHGRKQQADVDYDYHPTAVGLAKAVDILIAITPGGAGTKHMVNAEVLEALGPNGVLINVARGSVVDEDALIVALRNKTILAAGLDVFENEPNIRPELLEFDNVVVLPHVASASVHTRNAMGQLVVDNLVSWFAGKGPISAVPEHQKDRS